MSTTEIEKTDAETLALQNSQGPGEDATGVGPGNFQYSKQHETHLLKVTRQESKLLLMVEPANAGRVFKDGDLTFGVEAIQWRNGDTLVTKTAQAAQSLTDAQTNYIYYDQAGGLQVNITGFPTPSAFPHIPLATILTAGGTFAYTDITDKRQSGMFAVSSGSSTGNIVCNENQVVCNENRVVTN